MKDAKLKSNAPPDQAEMNAEHEWTVRPYRPGDERAIVELFDSAFGRSVSEDQWRWKLRGLPTPVENVWLGLVGDEVIFHYGGIPHRFQTPAGERTVMVSVDAMTAPALRRRGVLTDVAGTVFETWKEAGIPFTLGLPNEQWGSRTRALGWEELFRLRWLVRPLRPAGLLGGRLGTWAAQRLRTVDDAWSRLRPLPRHADAAVSIAPVTTVDHKFDEIWQKKAYDKKMSVVRDAAWVRWRYLSAPAQRYEVLLARRGGEPTGFAAFRVEDTRRGKTGVIASLVTDPADRAARGMLLGRALETLRADGAVAALTLAVPGTSAYGHYRQAGFLPRRRDFTVCLVPLAEQFPLGFLRHPGNWDLQPGDFDVV